MQVKQGLNMDSTTCTCILQSLTSRWTTYMYQSCRTISRIPFIGPKELRACLLSIKCVFMLKHINDEPPFCGTLYVWKVSTHLLLLQCIVGPNTTRSIETRNERQLCVSGSRTCLIWDDVVQLWVNGRLNPVKGIQFARVPSNRRRWSSLLDNSTYCATVTLTNFTEFTRSYVD